ncbi:DNA-binding transcriptional regulator, AcrR family [Saccharopolyspora antimicrobica]|uniref:DNA-binding transcriptional regulator, AcrR family n=1 Tax=Saccharopolyspora antimicrobica TaxID=455193 RepID=A0A1I4QPE8_9PSEU|nr:TetR/AcrR family transcriptional regulator [Saccharopolyspora antimicrobica]RKT88351.1 TetR family transcriptional regulator [Saccharopolyspora antimicrobica]SFM41924.1 DNA-binding transcriptional regulator, AcrR family [Saccharopolyspora antimicrobica]
MSTDTTPPLRADARRNRNRIISAARTTFAEHGTEVPMEEIARAAGVGTGTLYRRFPDRDSLIRAVGQDVFSRVLDEARAIAERETDPWRALTEFLFTATDMHVVLRLTMHSERARELLTTDPALAEVRSEMLTILDSMVRAAQESGALRPDIGSGDIALLLSMVLHGSRSAPAAVRHDAPARYLTLVLDGLQARPGTALPGRPVSGEDLSTVRPYTAE